MLRNYSTESLSLRGMLTISEVAALLHVHPNTVRGWNDKGLLNAYRLGNRRDRRFRPQDIEAFLSADPARIQPNTQ